MSDDQKVSVRPRRFRYDNALDLPGYNLNDYIDHGYYSGQILDQCSPQVVRYLCRAASHGGGSSNRAQARASMLNYLLDSFDAYHRLKSKINCKIDSLKADLDAIPAAPGHVCGDPNSPCDGSCMDRTVLQHEIDLYESLLR